MGSDVRQLIQGLVRKGGSHTGWSGDEEGIGVIQLRVSDGSEEERGGVEVRDVVNIGTLRRWKVTMVLVVEDSKDLNPSCKIFTE